MNYDDNPLRELTGRCLRPGGAALTRHGLALCGFASGTLVLDAGCGPGATLALLREAGCAPIGLDLSAALLAEARDVFPEHRPGHRPVLRADMAVLPLAAGCLGGIVCECALSLALDKAAVLREWARALKRGGRLLVSDLVRSGVLERREQGCYGPAGAGKAEPGAGGGAEALRKRAGIPCAAGAEPVSVLVDRLASAGFAVLTVEDHTKALRELAARIVWHFGSFAAFAALLPGSQPEEAAACDGGKGLGYCLIVAEKNE